jgi:3,4-dihydroxy 2-butanone 4-phosphate synthase/GTP cyclohydrolase II
MFSTTQPTLAGSVGSAITALAQGGLIVVTDGADREDEGDLVAAASTVTAQQMTFIVRHTTGIVCTPMTDTRADALDLNPMVADTVYQGDQHGTAFTVTVDHDQTGTGVSAADRTRTAHALADPDTTACQLRRPGHMFPLRARSGGVLERAGHTEAAVDLLRIAGLPQVGVISEIVAPDGEMARGSTLLQFARRYDLPMITIAELVQYRLTAERLVEVVGQAQLPTRYGLFEATAFRSHVDGVEHLALVFGGIQDPQRTEGVLARVHSECLTGDVAGSLRCDCGSQFNAAMSAIASEGNGVLLYMRGHEGRGIGLGQKLRAYRLQEAGHDTVSANLALGLPVDARHYDTAAQILKALGVQKVRLITNNPDKCAALARSGIDMGARVALPAAVESENMAYLRTKRDRMGHLLDLTGS